MPTIPEDQRAAIIEAMLADDGPPSHRALAEQFGVSKGTIYNVARDAGLSHLWEDRTARTEAANASNAARVAEHRQALELESLEAAREILARRFDSHSVVVKTMIGAEVEEVDNGPEDWRNIGQAVSNLTTSATQLARLESDLAGAGQASGILDDIEAGLREARLRREAASRAGEE
ncbi:helix-turn-helix domain-containing protein [Amycolatopsis thermophila]|uniref:Transposase-like protein n=1 Tax=Amycolatopsis thermophila TaxID=206084 RepID=A0ABU0ERL8_9PSEU|nr:hypothetical protein [Amycolatopsis thermophila]MDQ0377941.1 transposase-like protein [Amycolatopsis thermophila]